MSPLPNLHTSRPFSTADHLVDWAHEGCSLSDLLILNSSPVGVSLDSRAQYGGWALHDLAGKVCEWCTSAFSTDTDLSVLGPQVDRPNGQQQRASRLTWRQLLLIDKGLPDRLPQSRRPRSFRGLSQQLPAGVDGGFVGLGSPRLLSPRVLNTVAVERPCGGSVPGRRSAEGG